MSKKVGAVEVLARGVFIKDDCLLVCRTRDAPLTYLPGGHVEFGEPARVSLAREIREELGRRSEVGGLLGVAEHSFMQDGEPHHEMNFVFAMTVRGLSPSRPVESAEGHLSFEWVPVRRIGRSDLEPAPLRRLIPRWVAGKGVAGWGSTME
jgi:ADP-ribose pyrophosphatase YjhB (NUDIX family)